MSAKHVAVVAVTALLTIGALALIIWAASLSPSGSKVSCPSDYQAQPPVILLSMDGFRASYLRQARTPTITRLMKEGATAPYMKPSYPTVTFPNHYTIVTGLYPESHGIIANRFSDPDFNATFTLGSEESFESRWWGGEPIWNTMTRQGKMSATYFWPGSDVLINDHYPTYWKPYNGSVPYEDRVEQVLDWLKLPKEERPIFITLYFEEPDKSGHNYGPDSEELTNQLERMDGIVNKLVTGLTDASLLDCVNLIVLADHGMAAGGLMGFINLVDYIPDVVNASYTVTGAFARIEPKDESNEVKYEMMSNLSCKRPDLRQYEKQGLPTRMHFSNNDRIEAIVLDMDPGRIALLSSNGYGLGNHGYDNYFPAMNALFLARGPAFNVGAVVEPFQNIELYNLMCHLTGVEPAPNNGTMGSLNGLLVNPIPVQELTPEDPLLGTTYPDEETLAHRLNATGCPGDLNQTEDWLSELDINATERLRLETLHLPWGFPQSGNLSSDLVLLHHQDHVTAYSPTLKTPLWSSFTLTSLLQGTAELEDGWCSDVRLNTSDSVTCQDYIDLQGQNNETIMAPLFPPAFSLSGSSSRIPYLVSNAVPSTAQQQRRWQELMKHLVLRWFGSSTLNLVVGPVYDNNADSIVDDFSQIPFSPEMPSDWFALVTRCSSSGNLAACNPRNLDTRAFIYPTFQVVGNCLENSEYALEFSAKVRDVEIATGLTFYPDMIFKERTRLELAFHDSLW